MICKNCGASLPDGAKFCTECGKQLEEARTEDVGGDYAKGTDAKKAPLDKSPTVWIAAAALCVIFVAIGAVAGMNYVKSAMGRPSGTLANVGRGQSAPSRTSGGGASAASQGSAEERQSAVGESPEEQPGTQFAFRQLTGEEESLKNQIVGCNSGVNDTLSLDSYDDNYAPGARNAEYTWDQSVFYALEGYENRSGYANKNLCTLMRRQWIRQATGNKIEYEIYKNPYSDVINKIISIEYLNQGLEVMEYYYTNDAKVSFVYKYYTDNYVSSHATPDKSGERFLFHNDCLVTWRIINGSDIRNHILGAAEARRMKNQFNSRTMIYYSSLSEADRASFDAAERNIINAAYNTYQLVQNQEGITQIKGNVFDSAGNPVAGSQVTLCTSDFRGALYDATTNGNGEYSINVPMREYSYNLKISQAAHKDCLLYALHTGDGALELFVDSAYLFDVNEDKAGVRVILGDALNYNTSGSGMQPLSGAEVNIREGLNNRSGDVFSSLVSGVDGSVELSLPTGGYTMEVQAPGYENMYYDFIANAFKDMNVYEFYATPKMNSGEYRVVLSWGERPYDLDSHLFSVVGGRADHVWYCNMRDGADNELDVDDQSSYGPETVTIKAYNSNDYYKYCVTDYTNLREYRFDSYEMSYSNARVDVYSENGLIATFHVPTAVPGTVWEVFEMRNGSINPIQRYYKDAENTEWWLY